MQVHAVKCIARNTIFITDINNQISNLGIKQGKIWGARIIRSPNSFHTVRPFIKIARCWKINDYASRLFRFSNLESHSSSSPWRAKHLNATTVVATWCDVNDLRSNGLQTSDKLLHIIIKDTFFLFNWNIYSVLLLNNKAGNGINVSLKMK